ncbi:MAG: YdcH family protein [Proteobacteria bacterium]|nr:YdcH family protein [Pseudomonadota bacterium]
MNEKIALVKQLEGLRDQHRELDEVIARLSREAASNPIELQRLKKRKLMLKDQITVLEDEILPDIIA